MPRPGYQKLSWMLFLLLTALALRSQSPNWTAPSGNTYAYTANVIATVKLETTVSNNVLDKVAFFHQSEIRGLGQMIPLGNGTVRHFVTLYSHQPIDTLTIKVYHEETNHVYEVQQVFLFHNQQITGEVDNPYVISIFPENNAPIGLLPVPDQVTIEGLAFDPILMTDYLIQPDDEAVEWSLVPSPNLIAQFSGDTLKVAGEPGFTGTSQLTVIATELSPMATMSAARQFNGSSNQQTAEVVITFQVKVPPLAPEWNPLIPDQGIVQGDTFQSVPLHSYENKYNGPKIRYDYRPVISPSLPAETPPATAIDSNYSATMTLIARPTFTPRYSFSDTNDVLVAYMDNEIRGVAKRNEQNGLFYLSIGGGNVSGSKVSLLLYSEAMQKNLTLDSIFMYEAYQIMGSETSPYTIEFAPIVPVIPDTLFAAGIYTMPVMVIDTSFTGSMDFEFMAMDPDYPQMLKDTTTVTFCIAADSSDLLTYYEDADGDGLGNPLKKITACNQPEGYVTNDDDCNDEDPNNLGFTISIAENSGIANDGRVCGGSAVSLTAMVTAASYTWSTGQTGQTIEVFPNVTASYTVTATYSTGCGATQTDTVIVESTVVTDAGNAGPGTLRNVLECIQDGGVITYDYPSVNSSWLTQSLTISKDVTIAGIFTDRPNITLDGSTESCFLNIIQNKTLTLQHINIGVVQPATSPTFMGPGSVVVTGVTQIKNE